MRTSKASDAGWVRAAIIWDSAALRRSGRPDAVLFSEVIMLRHTALRADTIDESARATTLQRAAMGLRDELLGEPEKARDHFTRLAKQPSAKGLLGLLLLAWMSGAEEGDFDRAERRLRSLSANDPDLVARSHCKLMTWSLDNGWRSRAAHHFEQARSYAQGDLLAALESLGRWFGQTATLWHGAWSDELVLFPSIQESTGIAAERAIDEQFMASLKSPWTRTWHMGGGAPTEIQSAEMQASWAGALWLLPQVRRQHAAMILPSAKDAEEVTRGVGLWILGDGKDPERLIDAQEARLGHSSAADLLVGQLHEGRSVRRREMWLSTCLALWDQMPHDLVVRLVNAFESPLATTGPHDDPQREEIALFASLVTRAPFEWGNRAEQLLPAALAMVTRSMNPSLVQFVPEHLLIPALSTVIESHELLDEDWTHIGWTTVAAIWERLSEPEKAMWKTRILDVLPDSAVPEIGSAVPGLIPVARLRRSMRALVKQIDQEVGDARLGTFRGWSRAPQVELARTLLGLGGANRNAIRSLVTAATVPQTSGEQRFSSLQALNALAEAGMLSESSAGPAFQTVPIIGFFTDNPAADQRLEDVMRISLRVRTSNSTDIKAELLAASRDSDPRVREIAVGSALWLAQNRGETEGAIDASLFGALYDRDPRLQILGVRSVLEGAMADPALNRVGETRIRELWGDAHRNVRAAIARGLCSGPIIDSEFKQDLMNLATSDRSWLVRHEVEDDGVPSRDG